LRKTFQRCLEEKTGYNRGIINNQCVLVPNFVSLRCLGPRHAFNQKKSKEILLETDKSHPSLEMTPQGLLLSCGYRIMLSHEFTSFFLYLFKLLLLDLASSTLKKTALLIIKCDMYWLPALLQSPEPPLEHRYPPSASCRSQRCPADHLQRHLENIRRLNLWVSLISIL